MAKSRASFNDTVSAFNGTMASIGRREFAPIYLLMGEESYFIDQISDLLSCSILTESEREFNQVTLYGRDHEAGAVVNFARQVPMMGGRNVVIVKEAQQMRSLDKLAIYTTSPLEQSVLVICHKEKSVDKRSQLYKSSLKNGVVVESIRPRDYELGGWLSSFLSSQGLSLSQRGQMMLSESLGSDLGKIAGEIEKLKLALPQGAQIISEDDIERNIGISKEFNNFELVAAVSSRDMARSLNIASHFAKNPKGHPLLLTIMVLFAQFKQLFMLNYLRWMKQHRSAPFPSDRELMQILKLNNPYALSQLKQVAGLWSSRQLFYILSLMREYDAKSKGIERGGADDGELLRELILKILSA